MRPMHFRIFFKGLRAFFSHLTALEFLHFVYVIYFIYLYILQPELLEALVAAGGVELLSDLLRTVPVAFPNSLPSIVQVVRRLSFQADPVKRRLVANGAVASLVCAAAAATHPELGDHVEFSSEELQGALG